MSDFQVNVVAPSRLHFGLLSFGNSAARQFGGVGAMIDSPSLQLRITRADEPQIRGPLADRINGLIDRWCRFHGLVQQPYCQIEVISVPRQHSGLGVGTQLALSLAAGLSAFCDIPIASPAELALSVGRGLRSAVGTHGFSEGGLIVEGGKRPGDKISPLDCRLEIPPDWRFVMICPRRLVGLSGNDEQTAFETLPDVPPDVTHQLQGEVRGSMVPALAQSDFDAFSESVFRYGQLAGNCFAEQQGGPYNGSLLTEIVNTIRSTGVRGVGQSSWGPTLFSLVANQCDAENLVDQLSAVYSSSETDIWISAPNNGGAVVTTLLCTIETDSATLTDASVDKSCFC